MLTLLFTIFMFCIFGRLLLFSIKAAWKLSKIILILVLLPIILIVLVLGGLIYIALPILIIVGIISCIKKLA